MTDALQDIVTIDGPSGSGKSTIGKLLADRLGYTYLDTGAMYRAVGLAARRAGTDLEDADAVEELVRRLSIRLTPGREQASVIVNGEDVSDAIRSAEMGMMASRVSALAPVRRRLTAIQREMGEAGRVVADGRDMGTVVFPAARHKFFLTADARERARRRTEQLRKKGQEADFNTILRQIEQRDRDDSSRAIAPLKPAPDAALVDTTRLGIDEVVDRMMTLIQKSTAGGG